MYYALKRARCELCIVCDNKAAVGVLSRILEEGGKTKTWHDQDECADFWEQIARISSQREPGYHSTEWMPGHLDAGQGTNCTAATDKAKEFVLKKQQQRQEFLEAGGDPAWISGNAGADKLADQGAQLH